jgi:hypothetical protein
MQLDYIRLSRLSLTIAALVRFPRLPGLEDYFRVARHSPATRRERHWEFL